MISGGISRPVAFARTGAAARNPPGSAPGKYLLFTQVTRGAVFRSNRKLKHEF